MRFMILVKATADSEAGVMPAESLFAEMGAFVKATTEEPLKFSTCAFVIALTCKLSRSLSTG